MKFLLFHYLKVKKINVLILIHSQECTLLLKPYCSTL